MPIIKSVIIGTCSSNGVVAGTDIEEIEIQDIAGTGELDWTKNGGAVPSNLLRVEVWQNGVKLKYPDQYTITPFFTPTSTRIQIIAPLIPGAFYIIRVDYS